MSKRESGENPELPRSGKWERKLKKPAFWGLDALAKWNPLGSIASRSPEIKILASAKEECAKL